jgi:succinoglycan biosynthesis transport protein ExoP
MSVEFRQRTPGEYARIVWKRKWLIILPTIAVATAIAWVVLRLPNVYESTTLLIVRPSTIPNGLVPTLSDVDLSMRINNIGQMVTSRSSLEPLILKYDLYREERGRGEPMENLVEHMRTDIVVEVDKSRNDVTNAFHISFRERDPRKTQAVTAELASKYVNAQTQASADASEQNKVFFDQQLAQAKTELDEVDQQRIKYMTEHVESLPSSAGSLLGQYTGLREQQKSLINEIGRLGDRLTALNGTLNDLKQSSQGEEEIERELGDPKKTETYAALVSRKVMIEAEIQNMLTVLKPANPDVIAKQAELDSVKREMKLQEDEAAAKVERIRARRATLPDLRIKGLEREIQMVEGDRKRLETLLDQSNSQLASVEQRINNVPSSEVALEALNRDYQTKKSIYDQLLEKKKAVDLSAAVQSQAQGETIQVIDAANLSSEPVAPKRLLLMAAGLALGLLVGLCFAAAVEVPRLLTIQTTDDAEHYTGLPVLVSVPELLTPQEARRIPVRRMLLFAAGVLATIMSIPALALALKMTHVFDRFAS